MRWMMTLLFLLVNFSAQAEIIGDAVQRQARFTLRFLQESGPDVKRQERYVWGLALSEPLWERLRVESGLFFAPDKQTLPRAVRVHDDWLGLYSGLEWSHPWFFRWFAAAGLIGQYERTSIRFVTSDSKQSRREHRSQLFPYLRGGLDYAINQRFELSCELGLQKRSTAARHDWFWGLSFGYHVF